MLGTVIESAAKAIDQQRFDRILASRWPAKVYPRRVGLAVSGGVDSMALASLCSSIGPLDPDNPETSKPLFHAFVVDHGVRSGSAKEAKTVAGRLENMGIDCDILTLDWKRKGDPSRLSNFETMARRLRFQALGRACYKRSIQKLLLAHHGDDQAETILSRVYGGYTGVGLRGIGPSGPIPECHGSYGVSESGKDERIARLRCVRLEGDAQHAVGGITLHRPLLDFTKAELVATCQERKVTWFEDVTNVDKTLTVRNAVRYMFRHHNMPAALSPRALQLLSKTQRNWHQSCRDAARLIFHDCRIKIDVGSSTLSFSFPPDIHARIASHDNTMLVAALLLRKLLELSETESMLKLQDLFQTVKLVFPSLFGEAGPTVRSVSIGNITVTLQDSHLGQRHQEITKPQGVTDAVPDIRDHEVGALNMPIYSVQPRLPAKPERYEQILIPEQTKERTKDNAVWTPNKLFFDRHWIRIKFIPHNVPPGVSIIVRFLTKDDVVAIRADDVRTDDFEKLLKRHARGNIRYTLPAIVERARVPQPDGSVVIEDLVWALPSIGWHQPGWGSSRAKHDYYSKSPTEEGIAWWYSCYSKNVTSLFFCNHVIAKGSDSGLSVSPSEPSGERHSSKSQSGPNPVQGGAVSHS